MHRARLGFLSAVAVSASLAIATVGWSRPQPSAPVHSVAVHRTESHPFRGRRDDLLGWIMAWHNNGSCHGYPDVMEVYVLYGDAETNTITSWSDDGHTDGTDSCSVGYGATWDTGLHMYDGHVQGNPGGSTTWTPDDGICDGCLAQGVVAADVLNASRFFVGADLSVGAHRFAPWDTRTTLFSVRNARATLVLAR
jgi:hypothetical protein